MSKELTKEQVAKLREMGRKAAERILRELPEREAKEKERLAALRATLWRDH